MTNHLQTSDIESNPVWQSWQKAKQEVVHQTWEKENSRGHWRAMMEECKAECAWMIEKYRLENAERIVEQTMALVGEILLGKKPASPPAGIEPPASPVP